MAFTHLHVHSHYSLLDGLPQIPNLVGFAKKQGFDALALTDHGVMHGIIEFYKTALAQNIKPILGVEAYVAPRKLTDKQAHIDDSAAHLLLLARNLTGYKNLLKLVTIAHLQGFYYKPRLDHPTLKQYSEGLVATSACFKGEIPQALRRGDKKGADCLIQEYLNIFGEGNFYLEVQSHPELPEQVELNTQIRELSKKFSLPIIATNDSHYLESGDSEAQDILVCIQTGKKVTDEKRLDMRGVNTSLKSEHEMRTELPNFLDAVDAAYTLGQELNVELPLGKHFFPSFAPPKKLSDAEYLRELAVEGLQKHYPQGSGTEVKERLEYELDIITKKGYTGYFLVVGDFVNWARRQGIIATTRGSAAGSLTSFLIGITTVNPLTYKLPFERFLNPHRPSPPDIDMDFADNRRDEVIAYVTERYGVDHVAQIVTFGTMAARAAVRDVGRALDYPYSLCDRLAKLIPLGQQGFHMTIERALKETAELKALYDSDPQVLKLIELAKKLEGCARHASVHAAGVVISPTPLTDYTPLQYDVDGKNVITQFDMWACEDAGLVKMDFLGIRNLSILGSAITIVEKTKGVKINLETIPLDDQKTFELMSKGETMGMFQLGGSGMTRYLKELKPNNITDIMAMVALFRPGPMNSIPDFIKRKHSPRAITYLDPRLKEILSASYGIITYQDDVLLIAINIAGYSWEEADKLRKAMGKKIPAEMAKQKVKFISGCINHGKITEDKAQKLWELIEPFAAYGFNKAHAASYGIVAYQTAYLKANYPTEFMSALMTAESGDLPTIAQAVNECAHLGITVLPPDVNESLANFTVVDNNCIRFGFTAIKNLGQNTVKGIIDERKKSGPFFSLENFLQRLSGREMNKKSLESLIKCGALDSFKIERKRLLSAIEALLAFSKTEAKAKQSNQTSLFGAGLAQAPKLHLPESEPASQSELLAWEKELLGLYVTDHPLTNYIPEISTLTTSLGKLPELPERDSNILVVGMLVALKQINTKKGDPMMFATIEDNSGNAEIIFFPETYKQYRSLIQGDKVVAVRGRVSRKDGEVKIIVQSITHLPVAEEAKKHLLEWQGLRRESHSTKEPISLTLPPNADTKTMAELKQLFLSYPGECPITLIIEQSALKKTVSTPYRIEATPSFWQACNKILGDDQHRTLHDKINNF